MKIAKFIRFLFVIAGHGRLCANVSPGGQTLCVHTPAPPGVLPFAFMFVIIGK